LVESCDRVVRTSDLESTDGLEILGFEPQPPIIGRTIATGLHPRTRQQRGPHHDRGDTSTGGTDVVEGHQLHFAEYASLGSPSEAASRAGGTITTRRTTFRTRCPHRPRGLGPFGRRRVRTTRPPGGGPCASGTHPPWLMSAQHVRRRRLRSMCQFLRPRPHPCHSPRTPETTHSFHETSLGPWEPCVTECRRRGMSEKKLPSLDDLLAQSERVDRRLLDRKRQNRQNSERRIKAQDDWGLVEVVVDARGRVQEVAINADLAARTNLTDLAEAMLQAARAAQTQAEALS